MDRVVKVSADRKHHVTIRETCWRLRFGRGRQIHLYISTSQRRRGSSMVSFLFVFHVGFECDCIWTAIDGHVIVGLRQRCLLKLMFVSTTPMSVVYDRRQWYTTLKIQVRAITDSYSPSGDRLHLQWKRTAHVDLGPGMSILLVSDHHDIASSDVVDRIASSLNTRQA